MEIKKGYKQTEIGIIPEDWEIKRLGEIGEIRMCKRVFKAQTSISENIPFYKIGTFGNIPDAFISQELYDDFRLKYYYPKKGEILFSAAGTIGRTVIFDGKPAYFQDSNIVWIDNDEKIITNQYLYYFYKVVQWMTSDGGIVSRLYNEHIRNTQIFLPPSIAEQTAIATVLSDTDALITALDKLIAKKKLIKQGAMQELLTGKKRLKGFSGEWVEKKLGEIAEIKDGTHQTPQYVNDGIPFYSVENVTNNDFINTKSISIEEHKILTKSYRIEKGDVLMTRIGSIGVCKLVNWDVEASFYVSLALLKFKKGYSSDYFTQYSNTNLFIKEIEDHSLQHATPRKINLGNISFVKVYFPKSVIEQTAIATILTDMDAEISALEAKRDKYKQLKIGMMQQLLTGQIRFVNTSAQSKKLSENRTISIAAHIVGGHIVNKLYGSKGWGRTKLQKSLHLVGYCCQLDFGNEYIRNVAGPDDQLLMQHIDSKFRQYGHVRIEIKKDNRGSKHYNYIPTSKIVEIEQAFDGFPIETREDINNLLSKIKKMDLARAEIVSTLYAVWNNRIIMKQTINDDLLLKDFFDWSAHKSDFSKDLVLRGLNYMRQERIIPIGWGKYIDKSKV